MTASVKVLKTKINQVRTKYFANRNNEGSLKKTYVMSILLYIHIVVFEIIRPR